MRAARPALASRVAGRAGSSAVAAPRRALTTAPAPPPLPRQARPLPEDPSASGNRRIGAALGLFVAGVMAYTMWGISRVTRSALGPEFDERKGDAKAR